MVAIFLRALLYSSSQHIWMLAWQFLNNQFSLVEIFVACRSRGVVMKWRHFQHTLNHDERIKNRETMSWSNNCGACLIFVLSLCPYINNLNISQADTTIQLKNAEKYQLLGGKKRVALRSTACVRNYDVLVCELLWAAEQPSTWNIFKRRPLKSLRIYVMSCAMHKFQWWWPIRWKWFVV